MGIDDYRKYEPFFGSWYFEEAQCKLGSGSFGSVYRVVRKDAKVNPSALKIMTIPRDDSEIRTRRLEGMEDAGIARYYQRMVDDIKKEYELMSELKGCSNVVSCEDFMAFRHEDGFGFDIVIRMELLTPLAVYESRNAVDEFTVMKLGIDMCLALERCEMKNIIHRDIKPDNIFVSDMGDFKLGDFGIARTMEHSNLSMSSRIGTPNYMAPEVYFSKFYDRTADIYSLGIVLYRMLNDRILPFFSSDGSKEMREQAFLRRINGEPLPPPLHGDRALKSIVLKACAYNRQERYQHPQQMRQDLEMVSATLKCGGTIPEEFAANLDATVAMTNRDLTTETERGDLPDAKGTGQGSTGQVPEESKKKKRWAIAGVGFALSAAVLSGIWGLAKTGDRGSANQEQRMETETKTSLVNAEEKKEKEQTEGTEEPEGSTEKKGTTEAEEVDPKLSVTKLSGKDLDTLSHLEDYKNLESLDLAEMEITDIKVVKKLPVLRELNISYTNVTDLSPLKTCTSLKKLDISYNNENLAGKKAMAVLSEMTGLQELDLTGNMAAGQYEEMLAGLTKLELLRAGGTGISDGAFLKKLKKLKTLDLQSNLGLEKFQVLTGLSKLESLNISVTGITSLAGIENLKNLKELDISMTDISDISMLDSLGHLERVTLTETPELSGQLKTLKKSMKNCRFVTV